MISAKRDGVKITFTISGRLDANTAKELEMKLSEIPRHATCLIFDLKSLRYVSSMGLRSILQAHKMMEDRQGELSFINIPEDIRTVFEISGFIGTIVRDERVAIILKGCGNGSAAYSIAGSMAKSSADQFRQHFSILQGDGIKNLTLDCSELRSLTLEAGLVFAQIRTDILKDKGVFIMENINDNLQEKLKENKLHMLLPFSKESEIEEAEEVDETGKPKIPAIKNIFLTYHEWDPSSIAPFDKNYLDGHKGLERIVMNFKAVKDIPEEGLQRLRKLQKDYAEKGINVELDFE